MSKSSIKKIVTCIVVIMMVLLIAKTTFAVENIFDLKDDNKSLTSDDPNTPATQIQEGNVQEGNTQEGNSDNNKKLEDIQKNAEEKPANSAPTTTPYTGIGDYSSYVFIGIFAISAIYAYKKIRDYNA